MVMYQKQFDTMMQALKFGERHRGQQLERIHAQLAFAHQLCELYPDEAPAWQKSILEAGTILQDGLNRVCLAQGDLVAQAEAALTPIGEVAKTYTLLCISHAHIDMNWMWGWPETVAIVNDTFQTMLTLMDEYPDFIFSQDQASTYALIEKHNPAMFAQIQQRVKEGRWEVTASQWVEGDKNMASGESLSRHLLYTRAYFQEKFGLTPEDLQVDFEPDTFGHAATLPTILARGGVKYYYHCRGSRGPHMYWWVGTDDARVLALNDVPWYMHMDAGQIAVTPAVVKPLVDFTRSTGLNVMPMVYGVGDHGGGPTRRDLNRLIEMDIWPIYPNIKFSTLHNFFRIAEANARADLPEITGERNRVFTGCYTSQARQKWANRHGENLLYTAEVAATLGDRLAGVPYPHTNLRRAWTNLLFDQFHDILPGSGVRDTRHFTMGHAQETQAFAGMARTNALRALAARVDTASLRRDFDTGGVRDDKDVLEGRQSQGAGAGSATGTGGESAFSVARTADRAFLVFNPLAYPRTEVIEVKLWDTQLNLDHLVVSGEGMVPQRVQVLEKGHYWGHDFVTVAFPVDIPALGYRAVCVSDRLLELGMQPASPGDAWAGMWGDWRTELPPDYSLENDVLKVMLDSSSGGLVSLVDKRTGREWVPEGSLLGALEYCVEAGNQMSAWVIGEFARRDCVRGGTLKCIHTGPYVNTWRWTGKVNQTTLALDITLRQSAVRVDFRLRVDWREMGTPDETPHLRVRFPLALEHPQARYEIPYGSLVRDLCNGEEVVAQRWTDVACQDGTGATLVNTSRYGHSLDGDTLALTLLRATTHPDPLPDLGEHVIEYALLPHGAGWTVGDAMQAGESFNAPLTVTSCGFQTGALPSTLSLVAVETANVRLTALKQSEDGASMVLRLVEVEGKDTEACVTFAPVLLDGVTSACEVDTLERPLAENGAQLDGRSVTVTVPAFGIVTVKLS